MNLLRANKQQLRENKRRNNSELKKQRSRNQSPI